MQFLKSFLQHCFLTAELNWPFNDVVSRRLCIFTSDQGLNMDLLLSKCKQQGLVLDYSRHQRSIIYLATFKDQYMHTESMYSFVQCHFGHRLRCGAHYGWRWTKTMDKGWIDEWKNQGCGPKDRDGWKWTGVSWWWEDRKEPGRSLQDSKCRNHLFFRKN